jgi:LmbE family N-acetylglucosaminyl deacetylase
MKKFIGICAHADDELSFAGTITKIINQKGKGVLICLTGDKKRQKEFINSCKILKCKPILFNYKNRSLASVSEQEISNKLIKIIRGFKPEVILTVSNYDYHPDHKKVIDFINIAVEFASHGNKEEAWLVEKTLCFESSNLFPYPDYLINIDKEFKTKISLIKTYPSQINLKYKKNYYPELIRKKSEMRGVMAGCKYAEACIELKFPIHGNFYCKNRTIKDISKLLK